MASSAARRLVQGAAEADPYALMAFAGHLFDAGHRDQAVFWFYAGQLRARYMRESSREGGQVLAAFIIASESINAYAMADATRFSAMAKRVLAWDKLTFDDWAWAQDVYFTDREVIARRERARDGFGGFAKGVQEKRDEYEKRGREALANDPRAKPMSPPHPLSTMPAAALEPPTAPPPAQSSTLYVEPGQKPERLGKVEIAAREFPIAGRDAQYWVSRYYEWQEKARRHGFRVQEDTTGELCAKGQGGPVWFLTNFQWGKAVRNCSIPAGVHVLIPVFEVLLATTGAVSYGCTDLEGYARKWVSEGLNVRLAIDHQELKHLAQYAGSIRCHEREGPKKETQKVAAHGYWIFLRPLQPGTYQIEFAGQVGGENRFRNLTHDVTYALTVSKGSAKEPLK